ncbi:MAG TPA: hypothetical protein VF682_01965 [Pseudomonas sp.]|jgi:hypothetical protein
MPDYSTAPDFTALDDYTRFLQRLPGSLDAFDQLLPMGVTTVLIKRAYRIRERLDDAHAQRNTWQNYPASLHAVQNDLTETIDKLMQASQTLMNQSGSVNTSDLFELATTSIYRLTIKFKEHQTTLETLVKNIQSLIPRLLDSMDYTLYVYSDITGSTVPAARTQITAFRSEYALSHLAASNLSGYFIRLTEMTAQCVYQAILLKDVNERSRLKFRIQLLFVTLREIQKLSESIRTTERGLG